MKILCLQLARFGDIYQTWPALRALRRTYPDAEIHFLVRERFSAAAHGLDAIDQLHVLRTQDLLLPLMAPHPNIESSLQRVSTFVAQLENEHFDQIINLSFSPASSYLVDLVADQHTVIAGYTRFSDGYLAIPDDASAYFYAQVGIDRANRIHLCDLFALIAGVELSGKDFTAPVIPEIPAITPYPYIVVHVGASQEAKACPQNVWEDISHEILQSYDGEIIFVGTSGEGSRVPTIQNARIHNLTGKTELFDLFAILKKAQAIIGCDSVATQIANLTQTPTLNISFASVRFWETGPRAKRSRVYWAEDNSKVDAKKIARELLGIMNNNPITEPTILKEENHGVLYACIGTDENDFGWNLTRALYMNHQFPLAEHNNTRLGFIRLGELARLGLEQVASIQSKDKAEMALSILNEIDLLLLKVTEFVPELGPVVRWFQTEKLRIGPGALSEVVGATQLVFQKLNDICHIYEINGVFHDQLPREELTWKS